MYLSDHELLALISKLIFKHYNTAVSGVPFVGHPVFSVIDRTKSLKSRKQVMNGLGCNFVAFLVIVGVWAMPSFAAEEQYDIAIVGGRVVDPESGLDAVRNVGISGDKIVAISEASMRAKRIIDARGRIVSPGFIDMHAHGQSIAAGRMQALDGVTTALDLEAGFLPVSAFYDRRAQDGSPINYGASVNWANARIATFLDEEPVADLQWFMDSFAHPEWQKQVATPEQAAKIMAYVKEGLDQGGLGIGILVGYAPGTGHKEYYALAELAAKRGVPTYTHARYLSMLEPNSSFQGMAEIISAAAGTGAQTHIVHLNSISLRDIGLIGSMIASAQAKGLPITTEAYPYGAGATGIGAALFKGPRWRERIGGVDASNFDVGGKRLTEEELAYYMAEKPGTQTVVHFLEQDDPKDRAFLEQSVLFPGGVIASDGVEWMIDGKQMDQNIWPMPENAWSHPRSAGTYARFLKHHVRGGKNISLLEAINRVSYGPAKILEKSVPQMKAKGRIQIGADADVVVFDLEKVADRATYAKPAQTSEGFDYVIVNGVVLVEGGKLDIQVMPGKPVRNAVQ